MMHEPVSPRLATTAPRAHARHGRGNGDRRAPAMAGTRFATTHLAVLKRDGTRYDIQFPGTLELTDGPAGAMARYDLGRESGVALGRARHADGTVTVENDDARYVWSLA